VTTAGWARGSRGLWWLANAVALFAVAKLAGLRVNLTGSLPVGLYVAARGTPTRGALLLICLPSRVATFASARGYVPHGGACPGGVVPIGKRVVATAGDTVAVTPTGLLVNGAPIPNSRPLGTDRKGRPLPRLAVGVYTVDRGELWAISSYSRFSFDSRYFGAVRVSDVQSRLLPLWTASY
jgi:conjugative transfer signal peptidase TraF